MDACDREREAVITMQLVLGVLLLAAAVVSLSVAFEMGPRTDKVVRTRLLGTATRNPAGSVSTRRFRFETADDIVRWLVPAQMLPRLERNLMRAGRPPGWTLTRVALAKLVFAVLAFLAVQGFTFRSGTPWLVAAGLAAVIGAYFLPDAVLGSRASERQKEIEAGLPDALDKILISVEAGLSFEVALSKTAASQTGPLSEEFVRTVQDIQLGMPRRDAYGALMRRTESADVKAFVGSILQAEEHGVSVVKIIRIQANDMRIKRRLRAEAKAATVATKLVAPMMICIFPVLFVVVLVPQFL